MSNDYNVNYEDERFQDVENDKKEALSDLEETYDGMIDESQKYYDEQIQASKEWADKQTQLQQEQTDFAIDKIEQEKEQAKKDYTKEQSGAYVDWQKQSNEYGVNAEKQASAGLNNSGYAESSQVSMYNTYQNRVATARESFNRALLNYNNSIEQARLQNNSALAEIAQKALEQELQLSLQAFQYKNSLLLEKANKQTQIENEYWGRYQDVLAQINHENSLAEQVRQFNEQMALEREQWNWQKEQAEKKSSGGGSGGGGGGGYYTIAKDIDGDSGKGEKVTKDSKSDKWWDTVMDGKAKSASSGAVGGVGGVDMNSALKAAGKPVNPQTMAKMVNDGLVKETVKNGKITFQKASVKDLLKQNNYSKYKF